MITAILLNIYGKERERGCFVLIADTKWKKMTGFVQIVELRI